MEVIRIFLESESYPIDEFDCRVQAMEVETNVQPKGIWILEVPINELRDERPTEGYLDNGGADQQIIDLVVLPIAHVDIFDAIGIKPLNRREFEY